MLQSLRTNVVLPKNGYKEKGQLMRLVVSKKDTKAKKPRINLIHNTTVLENSGVTILAYGLRQLF